MGEWKRPTWHESLVGYAMIAGSGWYFSHLIHHPSHDWPWYAWAAGGLGLLFGMIVAWPFRTKWLVTQAMDRIPGLPNVEDDDD